MATRIQEILERIEKLKVSLQEKSVQLEERGRTIDGLRAQLAALTRERDDLSHKLEKSAVAPRSEAFIAAERVEAITRLQRDMQALRDENRKLRTALREAGGDARAVTGSETTTPAPEEDASSTGDHAQAAAVALDLRNTRAELAQAVAHLAERERRLAERDGELAAAHEQVAALAVRLAEVENILTTVREKSTPDLAASLEEIARRDAELAALREQLDRLRQTARPTDSHADMPAVADAPPIADRAAEVEELEQLVSVQQVQIQDLTERAAEAAEKDQAMQELMEQLADLEMKVLERDEVINAQMAQLVELQGGGR